MRVPSFSRRFVVLLGSTAIVGGTFVPIWNAHAATTVLSDCTDASLRAAVAAGGQIKYAQDCDGGNEVDLVSPLSINGKTVDIESNGHHVVLNAGFQGRLFVVTSGNLALVAMDLTGGAVAGAAGGAGNAGADRTAATVGNP